MSKPIVVKHHITDLGGGFAYVPGALIQEHEEGDMQYPGWPGRWVILEEVGSEEEAVKALEAAEEVSRG